MNDKPFDLKAWMGGTGREFRGPQGVPRSVIVRRRFDAPLERVWKAWTEDWLKYVASGDAREGETVVLDLGMPKKVACKILACEPPRRLAATWTYGEPVPGDPDVVETRLVKEGDGTLLELEHSSTIAPPGWAPGVGAGWESGLLTFDARFRGLDAASLPMDDANPKLDAFWTQLAKAPPFVVRVTKHFEAPPERVFDVWLDPARLPKWFAPNLGPMTRVSLDARVGGRFSFMQKREDGEVDHVGEYLEIDRPRRLAFTWALPKYSDDVSTVRIDIVPDGTGALLALTHEMDPKWAEYSERTAKGWTTMMEGMAQVA